MKMGHCKRCGESIIVRAHQMRLRDPHATIAEIKQFYTNYQSMDSSQPHACNGEKTK